MPAAADGLSTLLTWVTVPGPSGGAQVFPDRSVPLGTVARMREKTLLAIVTTVGFFLLLGCSAAQQAPSTSAVASSLPAGDGRVTIPQGATGADIARLLHAAGVTDSRAFIELALEDPRATSIQPGEYQLSTDISAGQALEQLLSGDSQADVSVSVVPGDRAVDISTQVAAATGEDAAAVKGAFRVAGCTSSLDGLLGPATYRVGSQDTAQSIAADMVASGRAAVEEAKQLAGVGNPFDVRELLTVASLVQAEVLPEDWPKASRAIINRLQAGMPLQLDSTAAYSACTRDVHLSAEQLSVQSAYNTYETKGLPPGPIGQVSLEAVRAAAQPAVGDWLYWVTVNLDSGETVFTASYDEFLAAKQRLRDWVASN